MTVGFFVGKATEFQDLVWEYDKKISDTQLSIEAVRKDIKKLSDNLDAAKEVSDDDKIISSCRQEIETLTETEHELTKLLDKYKTERGRYEKLLEEAISNRDKAK